MASRVGVNLRASAYLHQGDRKYMEDEFQVAYQRTHDKKDIEYAFFGIFDGHGGKEAAHFAKDNLMDNIVSQHSFWSENDEDVLCAIKEGFLQTHMAMWKELDQWPKTASGWPSTSGTTASVAFIRRQKIYIGHVGDSGIVLGYEDGNSEWVGVSLTRDHKPESLLEMNRITECGGKVIAKSGVPRVVWNRPKSGHQGPVRRSTPMDEIPFLAVARSLGDLWSYNATNDQFVVSPEPDVCVIDIDINHHRCLVFGTDGLWNALSPSTAVNIAYNSEKNNEKHYLGVPLGCGKQRLWINPSRCIVTGALERYMRVSLRADNTSAVTVYLDPPGRPKREVLMQQVSLKKGANSPSKAGSPKSPSKRLKEASVKVHVYNQTNQAWTGEGNRGLLCIKERLPEGEDPDASCNPDPSCSSPRDANSNTNSCNRTLTSPNHVHGNNSDSNSSLTSQGGHSNGSRENCPQQNFQLGNEGSYVHPCSECGCVSPSPPNHKSQSPSHLNIIKKPAPDSTSDSSSESTKPKGDDIQIPLVSSSTFVDSSTAEVDKVAKISSLGEPRVSKHVPISSTGVTSPTKRRTRSSRNSTNQEKSENKKIPGQSKVTASTKNIHSTPQHEDASLRVLRTVNRAAASLNVSSSSAPAFAMSSSKRKRAKDVQQEERTNKSLRIHTRSRTMSSKPMITRSQGKSQSKGTK